MKKTLIIIIVMLFTPLLAYADLSPASYYEIEIRELQLTISGMEERLACMRDQNCTADEALAIDETNQMQIIKLYREYNTTPSKRAAYYTHNSQEVDDYYNKNLKIQSTFNKLTDTYELLSDEINTLLEVQ